MAPLGDGKKPDFQRKALEHPALPLISGKVEVTELFTLDAKALEGRGAGETTCPPGVSKCL